MIIATVRTSVFVTALLLLTVRQSFLCMPFYQRAGTAVTDTTPYSKLPKQELTAKAKALIKDLRSLHEEYRKAMDGGTGGDRSVNAKLQRAESIQAEYDKKLSAQARDLEKELLRRLPDAAKPKDVKSAIASMLIKNGKLAGANPADTIASYIESLIAKLP
jgi:hypothetical protein